MTDYQQAEIDIPCRLVCDGNTLELLTEEAPGVWQLMMSPVELGGSAYDIKFMIRIKGPIIERKDNGTE